MSTLLLTKKKLKMTMTMKTFVDFVPKQISGFAICMHPGIVVLFSNLKPFVKTIKACYRREENVYQSCDGEFCFKLSKHCFGNFPTLLWKFAKLNFLFSTTFAVKQAILGGNNTLMYRKVLFG